MKLTKRKHVDEGSSADSDPDLDVASKQAPQRKHKAKRSRQKVSVSDGGDELSDVPKVPQKKLGCRPKKADALPVIAPKKRGRPTKVKN